MPHPAFKQQKRYVVLYFHKIKTNHIEQRVSPENKKIQQKKSKNLKLKKKLINYQYESNSEER